YLSKVVYTSGLYTLSLHDALPILIDGCRFENSSVATSSRIRGDIKSNQLVDGCLSLRRYEDPGSELYDLPAQRIWSLSGTKDLRSEEHTSELQSRGHLVCRLLLEK